MRRGCARPRDFARQRETPKSATPSGVMTASLLDLGRVLEAIGAGHLTWSRHGVARMQERRITRAEVLDGLRGGQIIEHYSDDVPYPSALVLGFAGDRPVHVVVALDTSTPEAHIVTVYEPSPDEFEPDWRTRRTP